MKIIKRLAAREKDFFFRSLARKFAISVLIFFIAALAGFFICVLHPELAENSFNLIMQILESKGLLSDSGSFDQFTRIFLNNVFAGFLCLVIGLVPFLFFPLLPVAANGFLLGAIGAIVYLSGEDFFIYFLAIAPHGIIELPVLFYSATLGLHLSSIIEKKIFGQSENLVKEAEKVLQSFFIVTIPLFALAAFVEVYVTLAIVTGYQGK
jgi:stage II sporulation protein M